MTEREMITLAEQEGFAAAAVVNTAEIVFDPMFRPFCAENLCGQYGVNYSCPPDCGSPEEMKQRVLSHKRGLVLQTIWEISDYTDKKAIKHAKSSHNSAAIRLMRQFRQDGKEGFLVGASGCALCSPCALKEGKPCAFRICAIPVCLPTASSCGSWRNAAAWNMTAARGCWHSSECTFLIDFHRRLWYHGNVNFYYNKENAT